MIRPVTVATFLMALGSGLYVYQSKHEVQMLDRTIEHAVKDTAAVRDQTHLMAIEYAMLTNADRMHQLADTYLSLKPIAPTQFTSLSDLDSRLPPVVVSQPPQPQGETAPAQVPLAVSQPAPVIEDNADEPAAAAPGKTEHAGAAEEHLPEPPRPAAPKPAAMATARPAERAAEHPAERPADRRPAPRPAVAEASHPAPAEPHSAKVADARPTEPRTSPASRPPLQATQKVAAAVLPSPVQRPAQPVPVTPAVVPVAAPYSGSLLGMARAATPAPRPTPFAAYNAN
ncbi:MAG TPA: hypothetical protein VE690_02620 [Rhodopila sp.]|nr:hypothetical protein [Rhodopila sp.]